MVRRTYNKLIRDRIPEIIHEAGGACETTILDEDKEYRAALLGKLVEESLEAAKAQGQELIAELADSRRCSMRSSARTDFRLRR